MLKKYCTPVRLIALGALVGSMIGVAPARSQEAVFRPPPAFPDRTSSFFHFISCENVDTGQLLNCTFRDAIVGLKPPPDALEHNGGHQHDGDHPLTDNIPTGRFECVDCVDTNSALLVVEGSTTNREATVFHALPQVTGQIQRQASVTPPQGFVCVSDCFKAFTLDVGLRDLQELVAQDSDNFVFKPREGDPHPAAHHGTSNLHTGIRIISTAYKDKTRGNKPVITDMSLPKGGMFDLNGKWFVKKDEGNGHVSHRDGHDVDFSKVDSSGKSIECLLETTDEMIKAFEKANTEFEQCYPDGHYHIRVPIRVQ